MSDLIEGDLILETGNNRISDLYETIIKRFVAWAETCPDLRFAAVIGSRARTDHPADDWADLDLLLVTQKPQFYADNDEWAAKMGKPVLVITEETAAGEEKERRVMYEEMLDVDYAIFPTDKIKNILQANMQPQTPKETALLLANALGRGIRVIVDKDNLAEKFKGIISTKEQPKPQPPTNEEFIQVVNDFLYHCVWTTKHIMRGELWWALSCLNCRLPFLQLRMTEWQARAAHGENYDTWFRGRFLENWATPEVIKGLRNSFAHYDENDAFNALEASMTLFRQISMTTAERLRFQYPLEADKKISTWIKSQQAARIGKRFPA